ncbi:hypothetical protein ACIGPN_29280 [Streptomyces afghaniensis]|uniref:hypothetical protein n=1 Tax=Streptomyces afghaniensis TaxID=66865 RepID=UPI0037D06A67
MIIVGRHILHLRFDLPADPDRRLYRAAAPPAGEHHAQRVIPAAQELNAPPFETEMTELYNSLIA